jgi:hypothetical protein
MKSVNEPGIVHPGFGDFLRGSICLYQYCQIFNLPLYLSFVDHPMGIFLKKPNGFDQKVVQEIESSELYEYPIPHPVYNFFKLDKKNTEVDEIITRRGFIKVITNSWPEAPITKPCQDYITNFLQPSDELNDELSSLQIPSDYTVIHIRLGDRFMINCPDAWIHLKRDNINEEIIEFVHQTIKDTIKETNILILSDCLIKNKLHERYGYLITENTPIHLLGSKLETISPNMFKETLLDFFIISKAKKIYQLSSYAWGSGFSDRCHDLYNIPIYRLLLPGSFNAQY